MMSYKISIITVCYNEPDLRETCESIINQTYQDFEWIVIDGGSNKETLDIFEKYKNRINTFISEKDNGIYNAMNKGIKLSHGEYLLFMNAGDSFYDKNVLSKFVECGLDKDIIYSNCVTAFSLPRIETYPEVLDSSFWIQNSLPHQATLIKNSLFKKYGMYDENYKIVSDYVKWIELIHINKCSYKHVNFIGCYFNAKGVSNNKTNKELHRLERVAVIKKYFSQEEIDKTSQAVKYNLFQWIFSIKNYPDRIHKIITIFGFQIKFLPKKKEHLLKI